MLSVCPEYTQGVWNFQERIDASKVLREELKRRKDFVLFGQDGFLPLRGPGHRNAGPVEPTLVREALAFQREKLERPGARYAERVLAGEGGAARV